MAGTVVRLLRNGVAIGEHAPAAMLSDSIHTAAGRPLFNHILASLASNVASDLAQAKGLVIVTFDQSPEAYDFLYRTKASQLSAAWLQVVDCYTDPLGWENEVLQSHKSNQTEEFMEPRNEKPYCRSTIHRNIRDIDSLFNTIMNVGKRAVNEQAGAYFIVAFDSIEFLLRHQFMPSVARLLNMLRSGDQVSSLIWLLHSDLHEQRVVASFEYIATMVVSLEAGVMTPLESLNQHEKNVNSYPLSKSLFAGNVRLRQKRRNGRVKEQVEAFTLDSSGLHFTAVAKKTPISVGTNISHKVLFNLHLTDDEVKDRAKVILPFEHQGIGREVKIYDGRENKSSEKMLQGKDKKDLLSASFTRIIQAEDHFRAEKKMHDGEFQSHAGAVHYVRDSDDEFPDSDEDPDDDLDI